MTVIVFSPLGGIRKEHMNKKQIEHQAALATQGYSADAMEHDSSFYGTGHKLYLWFINSDLAHMFLLLILSLVIEIGVFNHWALSSLNDYKLVNIDLSTQEHSQGRLINTQEGSVMEINNLNFKVKNIYVQIKSSKEQLVLVKAEFSDKSSRFEHLPASTHKLNTQEPYNDTYFHLDTKGSDEVYALRLIFLGEHTQSTVPVYVSKLVFNAHEPIDVSKLRLVIIFALLLSAYLLWRLRGYAVTYDSSTNQQRFIMLLPLLGALGYSALIYYLELEGVKHLNNAIQQELMWHVVHSKLLLAVFTLLALYGAFKSMLCYFELKVNAFMLFICYSVLLGGSQVFYLQMDVLKENFSSLIVLLLLTSATSAAYGWANWERALHIPGLHSPSLAKGAWHDISNRHKFLVTFEYALVILISIALLAWVRSLALVLFLALCAPVWMMPLYKLVTRQASLKLTAPKQLSLSNSSVLKQELIGLKVPAYVLLCTLIMFLVVLIGDFNLLPQMLVLLGAEPFIALMQINPEHYSWSNLELFTNAWYYYFIEPVSYYKNFPLVVPSQANVPMGVNVLMQERLSVLALPFTWVLAFSLSKSVRTKCGNKLCCLIFATIVSALIFAVGSFYAYGAGISLVSPLLSALLLVSCLLVLVLFAPQSKSATSLAAPESSYESTLGRVFYVLISFAAFKSVVVSLLLPFAYQGSGLAGQFLITSHINVILYCDYLFNSIGF